MLPNSRGRVVGPGLTGSLGWMQTPVQTRTHACVDPSPAQGPEVEPNHYASTPPCPHNAWAPLSARRPTHSSDSFHSGPQLQPFIFAWRPPFRFHCPGRLHGCQVETEASRSLRPPPTSHTLPRRPVFARSSSSAACQDLPDGAHHRRCRRRHA